jgi:hypothetical protein
MLDKDSKFAASFFNEVFKILNHRTKTFIKYVKLNLESYKSLQDTIKSYLQWNKVIDQAYFDQEFQYLYREKFKTVLSEESDILSGYFELKKELAGLLSRIKDVNRSEIENFHIKVLSDAFALIVNKTEPDRLSLDELKKLDLIIQQQFNSEQNGDRFSNLSVLRTLCQIVTANSGKLLIEQMQQIQDEESLETVTRNIKRIYISDIREENFLQITLAFLKRANIYSQGFGDFQIDYPSLFNFFHNEKINHKKKKETNRLHKELFYNYLKWAVENELSKLFSDDKKRFDQELENYLLKKYKHTLKRKKERKEFESLTGGNFSTVSEKVKAKLENKIIKFIRMRWEEAKIRRKKQNQQQNGIKRSNNKKRIIRRIIFLGILILIFLLVLILIFFTGNKLLQNIEINSFIRDFLQFFK